MHRAPVSASWAASRTPRDTGLTPPGRGDPGAGGSAGTLRPLCRSPLDRACVSGRCTRSCVGRRFHTTRGRKHTPQQELAWSLCSRDLQVSCMDMILFLQALEPRAVVRLVFAGISWCGDGPLYFLLFPLLYWGKAPSVAVRYGYLWGWAVLSMTVLKGSATTLRPFLAAPERVAFLQPLLAGFSWFPSPDQ